MGILKNGVGRPSNEIIKKRNIIKVISIFLVLIVIGIIIFMINKGETKVDTYTINMTDEKVISVVDTDPRWDHIQKLEDLPEHTLKEIREFFKTYKHLQNIDVETGNLHGLDETIKLIEECRHNYKG